MCFVAGNYGHANILATKIYGPSSRFGKELSWGNKETKMRPKPSLPNHELCRK